MCRYRVNWLRNAPSGWRLASRDPGLESVADPAVEKDSMQYVILQIVEILEQFVVRGPTDAVSNLGFWIQSAILMFEVERDGVSAKILLHRHSQVGIGHLSTIQRSSLGAACTLYPSDDGRRVLGGGAGRPRLKGRRIPLRESHFDFERLRVELAIREFSAP